MLVAVLPGRAVPWAQSKGLAVEGKSVAGGERRLALVIGNAAYDSAPLRNPVNDARAMAAALRDLGFEVTALENASLTDMKRAIDDFGDGLRSRGGVGLFYYSGHGIQVHGRNFIIPVGVRVKGERDVEYESVDVGRVLGKKGDFYFSGPSVEAALAPTTPSPGKAVGPARTLEPARTIDEEEALWKVIENSTNPVDFEEYLSAFPQGRFVMAARAKLRQVRHEESPRGPDVVVRTGSYRVQGTNPNGSPYRGTLSIERSGSLYLFRWQIGKDTFQGQGTLNDRTLTIDWGSPDPIIYQVMNDGTLEGTWAKGQGKENVIPEQ